MRERLLAVGGPGSGKTLGWERIAYHSPNSKFYVIDTEIGANRSLEEFPGIQNVEVMEAVDWPDYRKAQRLFCDKAKEGDWIVVDMVDKAWTAVQRNFISEVFDQEMGEYFMQARQKMKKDAKSLFGGKDSALKGWTDWITINRQYDDFIFPLVYRSPANLYLAAAPSTISEDDDKDIRDLYGPYGVKPAGQKALGHQPDTVLLFAYTKGGWVITTMKDRGGRKYLDHQPLHNLFFQYGVAIAKWH